MFHRIDIHFILNAINTGTANVRCLFDKERFVDIHRFFIHPHQHRFKITVYNRQVVRMNQHFSSRYIYFIFKCQCNRLWRKSILLFTIKSNNTLNMRYLTGRQSHHFIPFTYDTGCHLTAKSAEVKIRTKYILYGKAEIIKIIITVDMHRFQKIE